MQAGVRHLPPSCGRGKASPCLVQRPACDGDKNVKLSCMGGSELKHMRQEKERKKKTKEHYQKKTKINFRRRWYSNRRHSNPLSEVTRPSFPTVSLERRWRCRSTRRETYGRIAQSPSPTRCPRLGWSARLHPRSVVLVPPAPSYLTARKRRRLRLVIMWDFLLNRGCGR